MDNAALIDISEKAIDAARKVLEGPMVNGIVRKDLTSASGSAGYDLQPIAINLQPVITPWRNNIARVKNTRGGTVSEWRVISSLISKFFDPSVASEGAQANRLSYAFTPFTAPFAELGVGDHVTWAAEDASKGFEGDLKARAVTNTLFALMIAEEQWIGFGRVADLPTVSVPTVTLTATGGAIGAGASGYKVGVRAIVGTGNGTVSRGKAGAAAAATGAAGGSTNMLQASVPYVEGAVGYEWYVDDGAGGASTLQTTTGTNVVTLTALTTTGTVFAPSASVVANAFGMNGLIPSLTAALGATVTTLATDTVNYSGTDFQLNDIDLANKAVWDNAKGNPETIWMNSTQLIRATNLVLASNGAPTLFVQASSDEMSQLTGGYMLAKYVNKATGRIQNVKVHPYLPDGTMLAYSNAIPFPTGGDMVGVDIETSRDYQQVDYALTARRWDFEVFCREVLRMKFPGGAFVIRNIRSNTSA
jgi:hypothetical protein